MFKKTFFISTFIALFLSITSIASSATVDPFPDVPTDYEFHDSIEFFHALEILVGDSETGLFVPLRELNRAEFATVMTRVNGAEPTVDEYHDCFPDVTTEWYAPYVCYIFEQGWVQGYDAGPMAGMYGPAEPLLNAEIITVMARTNFWNTTPGGEWYEPAWNYALEHGIIPHGEVSDNTIRGLMSELMFRTLVVGFYQLDEYSAEDGADYIDSILGEPDHEVSMLSLEAETLGDQTIDPESTYVELLRFQGTVTEGEGPVILDKLILHPSETTDPRNIGHLYIVNNNSDEIIHSESTKLLWTDGDYALTLNNSLFFLADQTTSYSILADFDWETNSPIQITLENIDAFDTSSSLVALNLPFEGAEYIKDQELAYYPFDDPEFDEQCASFDQEWNLPYPSGGEVAEDERGPAEGGGTVTPDSDGHVILPIDQGNRGICAAASVYSSLRWFEERFGINLVENGSGGLEDLVSKVQGTGSFSNQNAAIKKYCEDANPCIKAEIDTQAGFNVSCNELKEYHDKGCDIPLSFTCQKTDASGNVITGTGAESWGHRVDLTNVTVNASDDDKCDITFANSWPDASNPGTPLDGLGAGRYEQAAYDDDDESFDIASPWASRYKCNLTAAIYICYDCD